MMSGRWLIMHHVATLIAQRQEVQGLIQNYNRAGGLTRSSLSIPTAVQEFVLGGYDAEATTAYNRNLSDISTLKDPHSKDASQRYHAHQYTNGTT
uniref:Uncharacterized protein n=1 Tax=Helianthus annuus TaxID=4232 RepID=A0A251V5H4_HELAN